MMINYKTYFLIFAIILSSVLGYKTFEQYQVIQKTQKAILKNQSQSLANFIKSFRDVYQDIFLKEHIALNDKTIKLLPVKTTMQIAKEFTNSQKHKICIRTVSDRPRNPANMANTFEKNMMEYFRNNPNATYRFVQQGTSFNLVEPLYIEKSCLKCHGEKKNVIESIKKRYDKAYNYKIGDLRGIINIEMKDGGFFDILYNNFKNNLIINIIILSGLLVIIYMLLKNISKKEKRYREFLEKEIEKQTCQITKQQDKLYYQANHDVLTGLPNRALFLKELQKDIDLAKKTNKKLALFFIDLDQFKQINDSLGHDIGDEVLKIAAKRLQSKIRENDLLARLGGDEFVTIINNYHKKSDLSHIASNILQVTKEPIHIDEHTLYISSSIGISLYPQDASNAKELLKYADTAMYKAKDEGRNNYQFYNQQMTQNAYQKVTLKSQLQNAVHNQEFEVYYQPQIDTTSNKLIGMEALCRWNHPTKGCILPSEFIEIAIGSGIIIDIDRFVIKDAIETYANWYKDGKKPGILSINLTINNILKDDFIEYVLKCMQKSQFNPQWLTLELIESEVMQKHNRVIKKLQQLSNIGISISIDDFGIGYSSLSYLKQLPIKRLKIDRSFISHIPDSTNDNSIVKAIIALASNLNLDIMAEGVENIKQKQFLETNGCTALQGFYYAKPMDIKDIENKFL